MLKFSIVVEEVANFAAARMDYAPQADSEMQAFERMLHEACEDMTEQDFRHACKQYRRSNRKWPSPAAVVELAPVTATRKLEEAERRVNWFPIVVPTRSSAGAGASDARLRHCFANYAQSRLGITPDDEDWRRVNRAVEAIGGWDAIGAMTERDVGYAEGRFLKALEARQEPDNVVSLADAAARRKQLRSGPQRIGGV